MTVVTDTHNHHIQMKAGMSDLPLGAISEFPNRTKLCKNMMILGLKRIFSDQNNWTCAENIINNDG